MAQAQKRKKQVLDLALAAAKKSYAEEMTDPRTHQDSPHLLREKFGRVTQRTLHQVKAKTALSGSEERVLLTLFDALFSQLEAANGVHTIGDGGAKNSPSKNKEKPATAIGIDLGTTYSCVGYYNHSKKEVIIIPNELGAKLTPSYIAVDDSGQILVGDPAKSNTTINPEYRVYDIKRLIGRTFDDPLVQSDMKLWSFHVVDENNTPKIKIATKVYNPEQLSAKILANLKKQAEAHLGHPVTNAVITIPAYFNDSQRQATKDAGTIAGLNVLRIINEPTAAAIAYCHQMTFERKKNVLVFDLGGGTLDISVVELDSGYIQVKAVGGDTHLGGEDFDDNMVKYCIEQFKVKSGVDLDQLKVSGDLSQRTKVMRCLRRLRIAVEDQKKSLMAGRNVVVALGCFFGEIDLRVKISRELFNRLNLKIFEKCIQIIAQVLDYSGLKKEEIDDIVMVGGSSRIPKIREMVQSFFDGQKLRFSINEDEAVAHGASLQAALLMTMGEGLPTASSSSAGEKDKKWTMKLGDVIPLPIGIQVREEKGESKNFHIILDKNSRIPCSQTQTYETAVANQSSITIAVYEGVHDEVKNNYMLGSFKLQNLPPGSAEGEPVDVQLEISEEGILHVSATCPRNRVKSRIVVEEFKKRLQPEDLANFRMEELFQSLADAFHF